MTPLFESSCDFCNELSGNKTWLSNDLLKAGIENRILIQKNGVVSIIGVGPLAIGYVLTLPKSHYLSIGSASSTIRMEIKRQKRLVSEILKKEFGSAICFEHGAVSSAKRGGSCIDHAHLHIIPGCIGFHELISSSFKEIKISGLDSLEEIVSQGQPYLYVEDIDEQSYCYLIPDRIPSQYLRQVWAKAINQPDRWDWGLFPNFNNMKQTADLFLKHHIPD